MVVILRGLAVVVRSFRGNGPNFTSSLFLWRTKGSGNKLAEYRVTKVISQSLIHQEMDKKIFSHQALPMFIWQKASFAKAKMKKSVKIPRTDMFNRLKETKHKNQNYPLRKLVYFDLWPQF